MTNKKYCVIICVDYKSTKRIGRRDDMTNTSKFEAVLILKGKTKTDIAKVINRSLQTVYNKINNIVDFKSKEIVAICEYLELTDEEREEIFFAK